MVEFIGTSAIQAHPVNEFGSIIDGDAIANILNGGTKSMVKIIGTSSLQFHPVDEQGNIIDETAIANAISGLFPVGIERAGEIVNSSQTFVIDTVNDFNGDYQVNVAGVIFDIFPTGSTNSPQIGQRITISNSGTQTATVRIVDGVSSTTLAGAERIYLMRGVNVGNQEWSYHKENLQFLLDA